MQVGSEHSYDFTAASPKGKGKRGNGKEVMLFLVLHLKRICMKGICWCQIWEAIIKVILQDQTQAKKFRNLDLADYKSEMCIWSTLVIRAKYGKSRSSSTFPPACFPDTHRTAFQQNCHPVHYWFEMSKVTLFREKFKTWHVWFPSVWS